MRDDRQGFHSVALVGMDGSGKSTQSARLSQTLTQQGKHVVMIHPFGRKLLSIIPGRFTPQPSQGRRTTPSQTQRLAAFAELIDIGLYIWAAYLRCLVWAYVYRRDVWLISDRSFDDLLVKHLRRGTLAPSTLARVRRCVPTVDLTIWLQTEPSVAMERDKDFQADYYEELYALYQAVAAQYNWQIVATSGLSPQAIFGRIAERIGLVTFDALNEQAVEHDQVALQ
jgi:thymidylate kinase